MNENLPTRYSSVFRANAANLREEQQYRSFINFLKQNPGTFDEVIFFNQFTHAVRPISYHREMAAVIADMMADVRMLGLKAGVNAIASVGFFDELFQSEMEALSPLVGMNGQPQPGKICGTHPGNREYLTAYYKIYASLHPDIIYLDDDISPMSCFCEHCLKDFSTKYPEVTGGNCDYKHFMDCLDSPDVALRRRTRESWIAFTGHRIGALYALIEKTVHAISPQTEMGYMPHMCGIDGIDSDNWVKTLSGKEKVPVSCRPGGGAYTEFTPNDVLVKANRISAQIRFLPENTAHIESEIENFPYQALKKSPEFTAFESLVYLAAGCTGTAFNITEWADSNFAEAEPFFLAAKEVATAGRLLSDTLGRKPLYGIRFPWKKTSAMDLANPKMEFWKDVPIPHELGQIGLPIDFSCEPPAVTLLNASMAMEQSDEELRQILCAGVYMDGGALAVCNDRGFGDLTGFAVKGSYTHDISESTTPHPFNLPGNRKRNLRQVFEFAHSTAYKIEKTNPKAEVLSYITDLLDNTIGDTAGIFENRAGGRVAVMGVNPFDWCFSLARTVQLKNIFRWLSRDTLPAFVSSFHRLSVFARGECAVVVNPGMTPAENVTLSMLSTGKTRKYTLMQGANIQKEGELAPVRSDGKYTVLALPEIPVLGCLLIQ